MAGYTRAGIRFFDSLLDAPAIVVSLANTLCSLPASMKGCETLDELATAAAALPPDHSNDEFRTTAQACQTLTPGRFSGVYGQSEKRWIRFISTPIFQPLETAVMNGDLSMAEESLFHKDGDLLGHILGRPTSGFKNPKPDLIFGLALSPFGSVDVLSHAALTRMYDHPDLALPYTPVTEDLVFPAVVYEAKSDSYATGVAKLQVAVTAARALALLINLKRKSGLEDIHPMVAMIVSAGPWWSVYLCTPAQDADESQWIVSIPTRR